MGLLNKIKDGISAILSILQPEPPDFDSAKNDFINGYGDKFHCSSDQYYRFQRALNNEKLGAVVSMNPKYMQMRIRGSYHPEKIYNVTLKKCECADFLERHLPCKHMYKLALELGIVDSSWDLSGLSAELHTLLTDLKPTHLQALFRLMDKQKRSNKYFTIGKRSVPSALVKSGFIVEDSYVNMIDKNYTKKELLAFLQVSLDYSPSASDKKEDIVNYIVQNEPKLAKTLCEKFYRVSFSEMTIENFDYIYRFLQQKI